MYTLGSGELSRQKEMVHTLGWWGSCAQRSGGGEGRGRCCTSWESVSENG
jgi:hypothetical protein